MIWIMSPQIHMLKFLFHIVNLFEDRAFKEVTKVKESHMSGPNPVRPVSV